MNQEYIYYYGSEDPVLVGDRILYKKLFSQVRGTVVYVPRQSNENKSLGDDTWAIQLDDEPNDIRSLPFYPKEEKYAIKKISLLRRGNKNQEIGTDEEIL